MKRKFYKMHGIGNDYLFFDCFKRKIDSPEKVAKRLSDRHFSVGGDGIILAEQSAVADAKMRIFNADGSEGKMCGNGLRCFAKFLYMIKKIKKSEYSVETLAGVKHVSLTFEKNVKQNCLTERILSVTADMGAPRFAPEEIPMLARGEKVVDSPLKLHGDTIFVTCLSMGNPHCVVFCEDVEVIDLKRIGREIETHPIFCEGVNAEFVQKLSENELKMRVFERGSGETLACGTGACAAAVAAIEKGLCNPDREILVHLRGGILRVLRTKETVFLTGDASLAFSGVVELNGSE